MASPDTLNEQALRRSINRHTLTRGESYVDRIDEAVRRGRILTAKVRDNMIYRVEIGVEEDAIWATCTCPELWNNECKHIAAVLLKWVRQPKTFSHQTDNNPRQMHNGLEVIPLPPLASKTPNHLPQWTKTTWEARQANLENTLSNYLEQLRVQDLRDLAAHHGWTLKGNQKAGLVTQLLALLLAPSFVPNAVATLNQEHQQVLWALALISEEVIIDMPELIKLATHWGPLKQYKKGDHYNNNLQQTGLTITGTLTNTRAGSGYYYRTVNYVPWIIMRSLSRLITERLPEAKKQEIPLNGQITHTDATPLLQTISQIIMLWEQNPPTLRPPQPRPVIEKMYRILTEWEYVPEELVEAKTNNRFVFPQVNKLILTVPVPPLALTDESLKKYSSLIGTGEYLDFIYHLTQQVGLFQSGSPVTKWTAVTNQYLPLTPLQQQALLARTYFGLSNWHEINQVRRAQPDLQLKRNANKENFTPAQLAANWLLTRQQILRSLALLPDDQWLAWDTLVPLWKAIWPVFDSSSWMKGTSYAFEHNNPAWYFTYKGEKTTSAHWNLLQGQFIQTMITGPLHWLGLADICVQKGRLTGFRLHGLGDLFWERSETVSQPAAAHPAPQPGPTAAAKIFSTGDIIRVNPAAISTQGHRLLEQIARLDHAEPHLFNYQLDIQRVLATFEAGYTLPQLQQSWRDHFHKAIPNNILTSLTNWWRNYGQVRLYENTTLIEFSDDYALAEMKAVTSLNQHIIAELSPRLVIINPTALAPLQAELQKAGYTPKVES